MREGQRGRGRGREREEEEEANEERKRDIVEKEDERERREPKTQGIHLPRPRGGRAESLSRRGCSRRAGRPSCIVMKLPRLRVSVDWAGLWFHSLATGGCPEQACHLAPALVASYFLCLLTCPPRLQAGCPWEGSEKSLRMGTGVPAKLSMS